MALMTKTYTKRVVNRNDTTPENKFVDFGCLFARSVGEAANISN